MSDDSAQLDPREQADDRVVHSLLAQLHDAQTAANREERVDRALMHINREQSVHSRFLTRRVLAAAAVFIVMLCAIAVIIPSTPARASLNDILNALAKPGDRTYRLSVVPSDDETQTRHGLDGATLYLRDNDQYLLKRSTPKGADIFDGFDGHESWRARGGQIVESQPGPGAGGVPMPQTMLEISFVNLQQTLSNLQSHYTINPIDDQPLDGTTYRHILAHRRDDARGPAAIEIWADVKSGVPHRIVFDRAKFQGSLEPRRLTFDLANEAPLPTDWFSPTAHAK